MNEIGKMENPIGENIQSNSEEYHLEGVPAFDPDAAMRQVEEARASLSDNANKDSNNKETENKTEHYESALDYIENNGLNDATTLEKIIQDRDYDSFKKHLVNLNGLMRNLDISSHKIDGERVIVPNGLTPLSPELKEGVLEEMFMAMNEINSPRDRGVLAYHTLGMLHLFADGNGRSQRVWYKLFNGEKLTQEKLESITKHSIGNVGSEGRRQFGKMLNTGHTAVSTYINDFAFEFDFNGYAGVHVEHNAFGGEPVFSDTAITGSSISDMDRIKNIFRNDTDSINFGFPEMAAMILKSEDKSFDVPEAFIDKYNRLIYKSSDNDIAYFGFKSPEHVEKFIKIHNQLKIKQLHTMIEAFKEPHSYKYNDSELTLADMLRRPAFPDK